MGVCLPLRILGHWAFAEYFALKLNYASRVNVVGGTKPNGKRGARATMKQPGAGHSCCAEAILVDVFDNLHLGHRDQAFVNYLVEERKELLDLLRSVNHRHHQRRVR